MSKKILGYQKKKRSKKKKKKKKKSEEEFKGGRGEREKTKERAFGRVDEEDLGFNVQEEDGGKGKAFGGNVNLGKTKGLGEFGERKSGKKGAPDFCLKSVAHSLPSQRLTLSQNRRRRGEEEVLESSRGAAAAAEDAATERKMPKDG
ncbi:unnamed protein product [Caenorhabditis nigoni]